MRFFTSYASNDSLASELFYEYMCVRLRRCMLLLPKEMHNVLRVQLCSCDFMCVCNVYASRAGTYHDRVIVMGLLSLELFLIVMLPDLNNDEKISRGGF